MTEKERILSAIIQALTFTMLLGRKNKLTGIWQDFEGKEEACFASEAGSWISGGKDSKYGAEMKPGCIVLCNTSFMSRWKIAEFVEDHRTPDGFGYLLIRELGTSNYCRMGNESFGVLVGMPEHIFYEGHKQKLHKWATCQAFLERYNPNADYLVRPGGAEFEGDTLRIWARPHIWNDSNGTAIPWCVEMKWDKKTRLKDIVAALIGGGLGTREFEHKNNREEKS